MIRYRYRVYPSAVQQVLIGRLFGCVRVAFNDALALRKSHYAATGAHLSSKVVSAALTASKRTPEREWLNEVSSVPLQRALHDLETAYKNFFSSVAGKRKGSRVSAPRFRKKSTSGSARFTSNARFSLRQVNTRKALLYLPKIGELRVAYSRLLPAAPSSVTLIQEVDGCYYASFVVNPGPALGAPANTSTRTAGLDLGLIDFAAITYSDGTREKIPAPNTSARPSANSPEPNANSHGARKAPRTGPSPGPRSPRSTRKSVMTAKTSPARSQYDWPAKTKR